ncbi:MAG: hypothetical protein M1823_001718 [Watsoniomyces obsoletus]|nr:MAG: hypothetical protein M1823_001718 [Watsoniomyces obsoletus]
MNDFADLRQRAQLIITKSTTYEDRLAALSAGAKPRLKNAEKEWEQQLLERRAQGDIWQLRKARFRVDPALSSMAHEKDQGQTRLKVQSSNCPTLQHHPSGKIRLLRFHYGSVDLQQYVRSELSRHVEVSPSFRDKPILNAFDLAAIIRFYIAYDDGPLSHERGRIQVILCMLVMAYTGVRPGSIVESQYHRMTNDGLRYKDVEVTLVTIDESVEIILGVKIRHRKHRRNSGQEPTFTLHGVPSNRFLCPVSYFLALAFSDDVFDGISSMSTLKKLKVPPGQTVLVLPYKSTAAELPVFRAAKENHSPSKDRSMSTETLRLILQELGIRAGYGQPLMAYNFRRGQAQKLDECARSVAQRKAVMGHSSESQFDPYYSHVINLDTQSAFLEKPLQQHLVEIRTGMAAHRDLKAPRAICHSFERLCRQKQTGFSTKQEKLAFRPEFFKHFKEQPHIEVAAQLNAINSGSGTGGVHPSPDVGREKPPRLLQALLRYHGTRKRAIDLLFESTSPDLKSAVDCLTEMCRDQEDFYCYPDVLAPIDGRCPYCRKRLLEAKVRHTVHLLECRMFAWSREDLKQFLRDNAQENCWWTGCPEYGQTFQLDDLIDHQIEHWKNKGLQCRWGPICNQRFPNREALFAHLQQHHKVITPTTCFLPFFCHECAEWSYNQDEWERHCEHHLQNLTLFCGRFTWRSRVVIAANCPFCLGDQGSAASTRWHQFTETHTGALDRHIRQHVMKEFRAGQQCPHPLCDVSLESADVLYGHFIDVHSMPLHTAAPVDTNER